MSKLTIYTDGGSRGNPGPAGIGVQVTDDQQKVVFQLSSFIGQATNNEAEYKAFLASLEWLLDNVSKQLEEVTWKLDSKLVVEQLNKNWKIKEVRLGVFAKRIWSLLDELSVPYQIKHVLRDQNQEADSLANQAMDKAA